MGAMVVVSIVNHVTGERVICWHIAGLGYSLDECDDVDRCCFASLEGRAVIFQMFAKSKTRASKVTYAAEELVVMLPRWARDWIVRTH